MRNLKDWMVHIYLPLTFQAGLNAQMQTGTQYRDSGEPREPRDPSIECKYTLHLRLDQFNTKHLQPQYGEPQVTHIRHYTYPSDTSDVENVYHHDLEHSWKR